MFKSAEKKYLKLKVAITGPSGSGKTYSALSIAKGLGEKIAVIDTENGSASLYSDKFKFDTLEIRPPYTTDKYIKGIDAAKSEKYDVLVIDSLSHAWAGEGGLLEKKSALDSRGGNQYTNWSSITKEQELLKSKILNSDIHIISTMRSKQEYVITENEKGKQVPKKVGMAPIQRDGMEYEFTVVFDLGMDHQAMISKDRTSLFDGKIFIPTEETGKELLNWIGKQPPMEPKKHEEQKSEAKQQEMKMLGGYGDYVPPEGHFRGRRIGDIPIEELVNYKEIVEDAAKKAGKQLHGVALDVMTAVTKVIEEHVAKERKKDGLPF